MRVTPKAPFELTPEQQEKLDAAERAAKAVSAKSLPIDEKTAQLIALPIDKLGDPEAIVRAAFATKLRVGGRWTAKASGVCLKPAAIKGEVK